MARFKRNAIRAVAAATGTVGSLPSRPNGVGDAYVLQREIRPYS
jgi:hypothetical protein